MMSFGTVWSTTGPGESPLSVRQEREGSGQSRTVVVASGCLERHDASRQPTAGSRRNRASEGCRNREGSSSAGGTGGTAF